MTAVLYFDLASPYAYLAVERAAAVLGRAPELEPVLVGAIFKWRGRGSWALTSDRDRGAAEIEARARRYGLPTIVWPESWPANSLAAMRGATWAKARGRTEEFARVVYRAEFTHGADIGHVDVLAACAVEAGLDGDELRTAIGQPEVKDELRRATTSAWDAGVRGVPTLVVGTNVFFGDDQLELAARAV